ARRLASVLREFRPDVVHVRLFLSQLSPLILPVLAGVPAIFHAAWYRSVCPVGTKMWPDGEPCTQSAGLACLRHRCFPAAAWPSAMLQLKLWRGWRKVFNVVVANSRFTAALLEAEGIGPAEVIWNGVPGRTPRPPLADPPTVVFAGRLVHEKGVDLLIRAFADARAGRPDAKLIIAGDGGERRSLERLAADLALGSSVDFAGHVDREQLEERFASAWVQVVPSRWREPFGIVAAEAMMRGTAVVATSGGGLAEFVQHERTGLLIPPNDANALASALQRLVCDRSFAETLGERAREFALVNLAEEIFVDRFVALYEGMVKSEAAPLQRR